jgi:hypothetical protein
MNHSNTCVLRIALVGILMCIRSACGATIEAPRGLAAKVEATSGDYQISAKDVGWIFSGSLKNPLTAMTSRSGRDGIGDFEELAFTFKSADTTPMRGSIRIYPGKSVALITETYVASATAPAVMFPAFTTLPPNLHAFSHVDSVFSPPVFSLAEHNMPWVMFDDGANTWIMSPASHFLASRMSGDGKTLAGSGLNAAIKSVPAGFEQRTILAVGRGISHTWDAWGQALTDLQGKTRPPNDADIGLKYFGYWTDNTANYYYNYDRDKGYAGTLLALSDHYRQQHIPLGYMQLDSWWYYKSLNDPKGVAGGPKSLKLPEGEWNRYGGLLDYKAHTYLFPDGLDAFQKKLGLPLITHNRWIDRASPYHKKYKITGVAAVDPKWWNDIIAYLKSSGVITYEQDWLSEIYYNSSQLGNTVDQGDAFMDNMARACKSRDLTMQYCMALPCNFLEGSKYDNLTTIRVSDDGFTRDRWMPFLFTSRLAGALGIWPWADVFRSTDRDCMLLADLSAGMVGIGDAIGRENRANIMLAVRPDGVIVKPDAPLVPTDETYLELAANRTDLLIASTYSDHAAGRTAYVFAYSRSRTAGAAVQFMPAKLGVKGDSIVYDVFGNSVDRVADGAEFSGKLGASGLSYYVLAPFGNSGIALLGDQGKFVSMGKQRIATAHDEPGRLTVEVVLADGEGPVVLHGYVATGDAPRFTSQNGAIEGTTFDNATKHFTVTIGSTGYPNGETRVTVVMATKLR